MNKMFCRKSQKRRGEKNSITVIRLWKKSIIITTTKFWIRWWILCFFWGWGVYTKLYHTFGRKCNEKIVSSKKKPVRKKCEWATSQTIRHTGRIKAIMLKRWQQNSWKWKQKLDGKEYTFREKYFFFFLKSTNFGPFFFFKLNVCLPLEFEQLRFERGCQGKSSSVAATHDCSFLLTQRKSSNRHVGTRCWFQLCL